MQDDTSKDVGARNLVIVFFGVVALVLGFYAYLGKQSAKWSPSFYIKNTTSERSLARVDYTGDQGDWVAVRPSSAVERGGRLYLEAGCSMCHGADRGGGIKCRNYCNATIPALNRIAGKVSLFRKEDVRTVVEVLGSAKVLEQAVPEVPRAAEVVDRIARMREVVLSGRKGGKMVAEDVDTFDMPSFRSILTGEDVDSILAFLLSESSIEKEIEHPLVFSHIPHIETAEIACVLCHPPGRNDGIPRVPNIGVCSLCHEKGDLPADAEARERLLEVRKAIKSKEEVRWQRVYQLPEDIKFSHNSHTGAGKLACGECHRGARTQEVAPSHPVVVLLMDDCVKCHSEKKVDIGCGACHTLKE